MHEYSSLTTLLVSLMMVYLTVSNLQRLLYVTFVTVILISFRLLLFWYFVPFLDGLVDCVISGVFGSSFGLSFPLPALFICWFPSTPLCSLSLIPKKNLTSLFVTHSLLPFTKKKSLSHFIRRYILWQRLLHRYNFYCCAVNKHKKTHI